MKNAAWESWSFITFALFECYKWKDDPQRGLVCVFVTVLVLALFRTFKLDPDQRPPRRLY